MKISFYIINSFRFISEILTFIILIVYGLKFSFPYNLILGIILPVTLLFVWGLFVAPKSPNRLSILPQSVLEIIIFATAYLIFKRFSSTSLPILFLIYAIITSAISKINDKILGIK